MMSTKPYLSTFPLEVFSEALGEDSPKWSDHENAEAIVFYEDKFPRKAVESLTLYHLVPMAMVYGDALTCQFIFDDIILLEVTPNLDNADIEEFLREMENRTTVTFQFKLDKNCLFKRWFMIYNDNFIPEHVYSHSHCRPFLFLYPEALDNFFRNKTLKELEKILWGKKENRASKVVCLIPDRDIWVDGRFIAIIGGHDLESWYKLIPSDLQHTDLLSIYNSCQDSLKWQERWLEYLTPLHLKIDQSFPENDTVVQSIRIHFTNLIILYTANRTISTKKEFKEIFVSTYSGAKQSINIKWRHPGEYKFEDKMEANLNALFTLFNRCYDPKWSAMDRLPLAQICIIEPIQTADSNTAFKLLIENAIKMKDGFDWHWQALIEDKVNAYITQVHELENLVSSTVRAFSDHVSGLIKQLSDTMLAAIGVVLGSFIAALFKGEFNPTIFRIGVWAYAGYILLFSLIYNMLNQWGAYRSLKSDFESRCQSFDNRLPENKVQEIIKDNVEKSKKRFICWFFCTLAIYVIILIFTIVASFYLPSVLQIGQ